MREKVLCPYCGREMINRMMRYLSGDIKAWFECGKCGARSPLKETAGKPADVLKAAKAMAMLRYEPPKKPLTLEEIPPQQTFFHESIHWIEINPCYISEVVELDGLMLPIATMEPGAITYESIEKYGKEWRLWAKYPSEDERKAAKWEE